MTGYMEQARGRACERERRGWVAVRRPGSRHRFWLHATTALTSAVLLGLGASVVQAQSVAGSGDVSPLVPAPPLPSWDAGLNLSVGATGSGAVTVEDGGRLTSVNGAIGAQAGSTGIVTVSGIAAEGNASTWDNAGNFRVGDAGTGTLIIEDGAWVRSAYRKTPYAGSVIGNLVGSTGTVVVSGTDAVGNPSTWETVSLSVGASGTGSLTIEDGAKARSRGQILGAAAGGVGTVTVSGSSDSGTPSVLEISGVSQIGSWGTGTLAITGGGKVITLNPYPYVGTTFLGLNNGVGTATISGTDAHGNASTWTTGTLVVGWNGDGTMTIADGGRVMSRWAGYIGRYGHSNGEVTVSGTDAEGNPSTWQIERFLKIGGSDWSTGTLRIEDGGHVRSMESYLGWNTRETGHGTVIVSGVGANGNPSLFQARSVHVGYEGTGTLRVEDGGLVRANVFVRAGSTATVSGVNSDGTPSTVRGLVSAAGGTAIVEDGGRIIGDGSGRIRVSGTDAAGNPSRLEGIARGRLTIEGGGQVIGELGAASGALITGTDESGNASTWQVSKYLIVFDDTLVIADGGRAISGSGLIANPRGSVASVTVSGTDGDGRASSWEVSSFIEMGQLGRADLTIQDGGKVVVPVVRVGAGDWLNIGAATADAPAGAGDLEAASVEFFDRSGNIAFNHTNSDYVFASALKSLRTDGTHVIKQLAGETTLTGDSSGFAGRIDVTGGTLTVANRLGGSALVTGGGLVVDGSLLGDVIAHRGGVVSGAGTIGGDASFTAGGVLAGAQGQTLAIAGDVTLDATSQVNVALGGAPAAALFDIGGRLTLDGTLNIADQGGFGAGIYRLFDYGGRLTDNGLDIGRVPAGADPDDLFVQTAVRRQVNLVSNQGAVLGFWDGGNPGRHDNGAVDGGSGLWRADGRNWTEADGAVNGSYRPNPTFAVFQGRAGTVSVDGTAGAIGVTGMQFARDGYRVEGDAIALQGAGGETIIRVGDGTRAGSGMSATIASELAGDTRLVKTDHGTLVLEGANSYAGGSRLDAGVLSVSSDANLGAAPGGLTFNGGTLATTADITNGRAVTLAAAGNIDVGTGTTLRLDGVVSGAKELHKAGGGTLVLTGANAYAGAVVEAGTLVGDANAIRGDIGNAGAVVFDQASNASFGGMIAGYHGVKGGMVKRGAGELTLGGASALDWTVEAGGLTTAAERFAGNVAIAAAGTFAFDQLVDATYAGRLTGTGVFAKTGVGTLFYDGKSPGFAGNTTVAAGALIVGSDTAHQGAVLGGSLAVRDGATLGGHGTIGSGAGSAVTIAQGGTLSPGNSIGSVTVNGDLTFQPGSRFLVEVDPNGTASDGVHVIGNATLNGGSVMQVGPDGNFQPRTTYMILSVDGTLSGQFEGASSSFAFLEADLAYDYGAGTVGLELERNDIDFAADAVTRNQIATASAIESIGFNAQNPVYDAIVQLPDDPALIQASFDQLSGEIHASAKSVLMENSHFLRDAVAGRLRAAFGGVAAPAAPVMAYDAGVVKALPADTERGAFWATGFGAWGSFSGDGNAASVNNDIGGFFLGADAPVLDDWRLGVVAGYSAASFDIDDRLSSGDGSDWHLGLYGGTQRGPVGVRLGLAYTWSDIETSRAVAIPGLQDQLSEDYNAGTFQAFGDVGYRLEAGSAAFEPFVALAYVNLHTDGFSEQGGAAALTASGQNMDTTFSTLGLRASTILPFGATEAVLSGAIGWRHAFGDTLPVSTLAFAASDSFTVAGVPIAEDAAVLEAGLDVSLTDAVMLGLAYQGQFGDGVTQNGFNARLSVKF